jgi:hypothetical protein
MKKMMNKTHIEGVLYQHSLEMKVSGPNSARPNTEYIRGSIDIATSNDMLNIVTVRFSYVAEKFPSGKTNDTYNVLKNIINEKYGTYMAVGDNATKLRIDSSIGLNEFYTDRDGNETFVSSKGNEGGFVHVVDVLDEDEKNRNTFMCDMVITGAIRKEADEEKQIPEKVIVKGAIFDFRNAVLPVEFSATNPAAMNYFEGMGATPQTPKFTKIWGSQVSEQIVRTITEESAFSEARVREVKSSRKDFVITGAAKEEYIWDSEESILASELTKAMTDRELHLAELKKRWLESKNAEPAAATTLAGAAIGGFKF